MKKYTCPDCGKVFLNRKPKACPQCGCVSENFVVSELVVQEEGAPQPQVTQPIQQPVQPQYQQPQYQQPQYQQPQYQQPQYQPQNAVPVASVQMSLAGFMNFLSVIVLLAGIGFGMYVLIKGCVEASEANSAMREAYGYYSEAKAPHQSAAPAVLAGLFIMLMGMVQFGLIRLFVKMSQHLETIEAKIK